MQITLHKKTIQNLVSGFGKVITGRNRLPVLDHLCFSIEQIKGEPRAIVRATDMDSTLSRTLNASEASVGGPISSFLLPLAELKKLRGAIKAGEAVSLRPVSEGRVEVEAGLVSRIIETMTVDEFPPEHPEVPLTACDGSALLQAMGKAAVTAAGNADNRPILKGVCIDPQRGVFVGTDGRRMTLVSSADFPLERGVVVPICPAFKFMLSQAASGEGGLVGVSTGDDTPAFELRNGLWQWHVRCIEGNYPAYEQVIPAEEGAWCAEWRFSDEAANTMLDAARQLPNGETREAVHLALSEKGVLIFSPDNGGFVGVALPECEVRSEGMVVLAVNRDYLTDALKQGFRRMRVRDPLSPLLLTRDNGDLHVLMPLRNCVTEEAGQYAARMLGVELPAKVESADQPEAAQTDGEEPEVATPETNESKEQSEMSEKPNPRIGKFAPANPAETEDPLSRLEELVGQGREALKEAENAMRQTRQAIRDVKKHYQNRERHIRSREQDMARNLKLIERLQEAVAA